MQNNRTNKKLIVFLSLLAELTIYRRLIIKNREFPYEESRFLLS